MALLLPLLMLAPWSPRASAQAVTRCPLPNTQICGTFETNVVTAFLQAHGVPASEVPLVYQYGRADLRNEVRANLFANLLAIIKKDPTTRTPDEQAIYQWMQGALWQHEQDLLAAAIAERDAWKASPCAWRP